MKRLGIYFFFDQEGKVDRYITYLLSDLVLSLNRLIIVCNGKLSDEGYTALEKYSKDIIIRPNSGLDVAAYKDALYFVGWQGLAEYDEILFTNSTIMGPVFPFETVFSEMEARKIDFWGITRHYGFPMDPFGYSKYGYIPEHIQSYFICVRSTLFASSVFRQFWDELPEIKTYEQSVGLFETVFTETFARQNFKWDTYVDTSAYKELNPDPLAVYPMELIRDARCPIFKRRAFFNDYKQVLAETAGQQTMRLFEYIRNSTAYDTDYIWENILRTCHLVDIVRNMGLVYICPGDEALPALKSTSEDALKTAVALYLYYEDMFDKYLDYLSRVPCDIDLYIITDSISKHKALSQKLEKKALSRSQLLITEKRGRDMAALWVCLKDYLPQYDLFCFAHDKKAGQMRPGSVGDSFGYKCLENILHSRESISWIIHTFESNTRLGLLVPPGPVHGGYYSSNDDRWTNNFRNTAELAQRLLLNVPMLESKEPVTALGNCFWFRTSALNQLIKYPWKYTDFPEEPMKEDGTFSHAMERIYPFVAQENGFYTGIVMSDVCARQEYLSLDYLSRELHGRVFALVERKKYEDYVAHLEHQVRELYPRTSIKWQIKDRMAKFFKIPK